MLISAAITSGKIDAKVLELIKEAHNKARTILEADMDKLHELAAYLLEKETITGEEFMQILEHGRQDEAKAETVETSAQAAEETKPVCSACDGEAEQVQAAPDALLNEDSERN